MERHTVIVEKKPTSELYEVESLQQIYPWHREADKYIEYIKPMSIGSKTQEMKMTDP